MSKQRGQSSTSRAACSRAFARSSSSASVYGRNDPRHPTLFSRRRVRSLATPAALITTAFSGTSSKRSWHG